MTLTVTGAPHQGDGEIHVPDTLASAVGEPQPSSPAALAGATDGSLVGKMLAVAEEVNSETKRFPVPGWDDEDGEPKLVVVARQAKERIKGKITNEKFIIDHTVDVLFRDDDGELKPLHHGWSGVALKMGHQFSTGDAVRHVLSNPLRVDLFAAELLAWNAGRHTAIEEALGES